MEVKWHIAFCNLSITQYAGITLKEYHTRPEIMLEAQLKAKEIVEKKFGVGRFIIPNIETPGVLSSLLGMSVVFPEEDGVPGVDTRFPVISDVSQFDNVHIGDYRKDGWMAVRWQAWRYYKTKGYPVDLGGADGSIVTTACEISGHSLFTGLLEDPESAQKLLNVVVEANRTIEELNDMLSEKVSSNGYIGDDFAGLLSPEVFRKFVIPCYKKVYADKTLRFLHSELFCYEHLRLARDVLGITEFHGAGAEKLSFDQMYKVMGQNFWVQLTPHELLVYTPAEIKERIKVLAGSGAGTVQVYPFRGTTDQNMEAAIRTIEDECTGGPRDLMSD